jgi:hypothetical protein
MQVIFDLFNVTKALTVFVAELWLPTTTSLLFRQRSLAIPVVLYEQMRSQ